MVAAAIMIFCAACAGVGAVYADEITDKGNPMGGLVTAIAQKFGLQESAVQAVFDEQKSKMEAERKIKMAEMETKRTAEFETRLSGLVTAGKLTQTQADAIKAKHAELQTQREADKPVAESMKSKTEAERKAAMAEQKTKMETERAALKQWAAANGIPEEYIPMAGLMGGGHGRGGFRGPGPDGEASCPNSNSGAVLTK